MAVEWCSFQRGPLKMSRLFHPSCLQWNEGTPLIFSGHILLLPVHQTLYFPGSWLWSIFARCSESCFTTLPICLSKSSAIYCLPRLLMGCSERGLRFSLPLRRSWCCCFWLLFWETGSVILIAWSTFEPTTLTRPSFSAVLIYMALSEGGSWRRSCMFSVGAIFCPDGGLIPPPICLAPLSPSTANGCHPLWLFRHSQYFPDYVWVYHFQKKKDPVTPWRLDYCIYLQINETVK